MVIGTPSAKKDYICIDGYDTITKQKIDQSGFSPSYFASGIFFYLRTEELLNFMRKEGIPFE